MGYELDALHPAELERLAKAALFKYLDQVLILEEEMVEEQEHNTLLQLRQAVHDVASEIGYRLW